VYFQKKNMEEECSLHAKICRKDHEQAVGGRFATLEAKAVKVARLWYTATLGADCCIEYCLSVKRAS